MQIYVSQGATMLRKTAKRVMDELLTWQRGLPQLDGPLVDYTLPFLVLTHLVTEVLLQRLRQKLCTQKHMIVTDRVLLQ